MKEGPILYTGPMVRAVLREENPKTHTRRAMKRIPCECGSFEPEEMCNVSPEGWQVPGHSGRWWCACCTDHELAVKCPYGKPGDRLWVRENWSHTGEAVWTVADARMRGRSGVIYQATDAEPVPGCWWPSIHLPREFSRIDLEITAVRIERLQEISEQDARAEGCPDWAVDTVMKDRYPADAPGLPRHWFEQLWDGINGKRKPGKPDVSWAANPWVWVIEFKRLGGAEA